MWKSEVLLWFHQAEVCVGLLPFFPKACFPTDPAVGKTQCLVVGCQRSLFSACCQESAVPHFGLPLTFSCGAVPFWPHREGFSALKTEGSTWRDEHWVLFCMLVNWTPIKNYFIKKNKNKIIFISLVLVVMSLIYDFINLRVFSLLF